MDKRLALVDDEEVFHWIVSQFLEHVDASVELMSFYNGNEILKHLEANPKAPDVILLDINMPIANGWVFLDKYSEKKITGSNIYVVSSSIDPEDHNKARSYACVLDFVSKPISVEFLEEVLR